MKGFIFLIVAYFLFRCQFFCNESALLAIIKCAEFERHIYCKSVLLFRFYIIKICFNDSFILVSVPVFCNESVLLAINKCAEF